MTAGKGHQTHFPRQELPHALHGARLAQLTDGDGMHYLPYFYNPHLDAAAHRLLYVGDQSGNEQAYVLDVETGTATQLTAARGTDQHWSPYIRVGIDGIRPQFVAWSQPDWEHILFWENNTLKRVHVETLAEDTLYELRADAVPQILHCSTGGWVSFGYIPREVQEGIRTKLAGGGRMAWDEPLLERLTRGCGFVVFDLANRRVVTDEHVPFWVNHIQASPANTRVLFCQEGPWQRQRMWLYDVAAGTWGPLREQEDGVAIGHEFWLDETTVAYHGTLPDKRGFFGRIDVTGSRPPSELASSQESARGSTGPSSREREGPSEPASEALRTMARGSGGAQRPPEVGGEVGHFYGHYHTSPNATHVTTDGEITPDHISVAPLNAEHVTFTPVGRHGWVRSKDQRHHPHPHWHLSGDWITFTGCNEHGTQALLLDVRELRLS